MHRQKKLQHIKGLKVINKVETAYVSNYWSYQQLAKHTAWVVLA